MMSTDRVSADLRAILDMADRLAERAEDLGGEIPGGQATVEQAPLADLDVWARRDELAGGALATYEDPDDLWPASQMLRFWSEDWRVELGMDHDDPRWRPTLATEAAFLANPDVLAWAWDHELHFEDFAADVHKARAKLEDVLNEGTRPDRSRVTCPHCVPQDHRTAPLSDSEGDAGHGDHYDADRPAERRTAPRLIRVYAAGDDPSEDRWKCPSCKERFDQAAFVRAYGKQMRSEAAERYVQASDAVSLLVSQGRSERTARAWVAERAACDLASKRRVVWWPDLWRRHLMSPTRGRQDA